MSTHEEPKFQPGDRVRVWITQRQDIQEGDSGTVVDMRMSVFNDTWHLDVILDTGVRMGNYHEGTFILEEEYQDAHV
mgnify:CR=1 FL=1